MPDLGRAFRRMRRLRGLKQSHAAELLGVVQSTLSRWESGALVPSEEAQGALARLLAPRPGSDRVLRRLVEGAAGRTHLVCDATHTLLAASPGRVAAWRESPAALVGRSLWAFASDDIRAMEARLPELGWDEETPEALAFWTGPNAAEAVPIAPGLTLWERVALEDGGEGRLVTTLPACPALARVVDVRAHI